VPHISVSVCLGVWVFGSGCLGVSMGECVMQKAVYLIAACLRGSGN